jgi:hypothetical protein
MREQLRLAMGNLGNLVFERFGNAGVQHAARLAQQRTIGRFLHQGMLEQVRRLRRYSLAKQQTCRNETI